VSRATRPRLKRCPWCLSSLSLALKPQEGGGFAVQCFECVATGPVFRGDTCGEGTDAHMAVYGWNRQGIGWIGRAKSRGGGFPKGRSNTSQRKARDELLFRA